MDYGPLVTADAKKRILGLINSGVEQGAKLVVDGRDFSLQGYENGFFVGPHLFRPRHPRHGHLQARDLRPGPVHRACQDL